ncbi:MAG: M67 family metallopeptidase [Terriglobia bacterium]
MARRVKVLASVAEQMLEHARKEAPAECCGLLAGPHDAITEIFPAANASASSNEYFIAPQQLIAAMRSFRERALNHLGIYHSHPHTENFPSRRDIELAYYPSCAYFIISLGSSTGRDVRAFAIQGGRVSEFEIETL